MTNTSLARATSLAATLAFLAGCGQSGEVGHEYFSYVCTAPSDVACRGLFFSSASATAPLAVGAEFGMQVGDSSATIAPAAPTLLVPQGEGFRTTAPGAYALLARSPQGSVLDFLHVEVYAIDHLELTRDGVPVSSSIALATGSSASLSATPQSVLGQTLQGGLAYTFSTSDASIATVQSSDDGTATVAAVAPGTANIHVSAGSASSDLAVQIGGT